MQLPYAVRTLGQRLFRSVPVRVRSGVNEGFKWSIVSSGRGYGSGSFGVDRLEALEALVRPGDCVWDVGAHKGFVTLAASRMVGATGRVVAIEPSYRNRWFIELHVGWNGLETVDVVAGALAGARGEARFGGTGDSLAFSLGSGDERVQVYAAPDLVAELGIRPPDVLKIDAEGQEAAILEGAGDTLRPDAALLISVHGRAMHDACTALLRERGFGILESAEMAACTADPERPWTSDYDLIAVGPERPVEIGRLRALRLIRD